MSLEKLSVVDIIDPQSSTFGVGVKVKTTDDSNLYDSPELIKTIHILCLIPCCLVVVVSTIIKLLFPFSFVHYSLGYTNIIKVCYFSVNKK